MSGLKNKWRGVTPPLTIKGNDQATAGDVKDLTVAEAKALLGIPAGSGGSTGAYPKYRIQAGEHVVIGEYEQYVIHGRTQIENEGTITIGTGAEILYRS